MAKYQRYEEYRNSGVEWLGEIPKGWEITALKRYCNVKGGYAFASDAFTDVGKPIIRIGDIKEDGSINLDSCKLISNELAKSSNAYLVEKGQLLMAMTGATIGKAGVYISDSPAYLNQRVGKFVIDNDELNYGFLWYTLKTNGYQEYIKLTAFGGAQPNISDTGMVDYISCFPSLIEQTQIANFLDHETAQIDTLIEKQQTLIQLLKEKRQAVISHAVTKGLNPDALMKDSGVEWLGEVPEHWEVKRIKHYGKIMGGFAFKSDDFIDSGYPVLKISNVSHLQLNFDDESFLPLSFVEKHLEYKVEENDLVFAMTRPIISGGIKVAKIPKLEAMPLVNQRVGFLKLKSELLADFILYSSLSSSFKAQFKNNMTITNQPNISGEGIESVALPMPPKNELVEIVDFLNNSETVFQNLSIKSEQQVELLKERRTALISAAVTGKIDVRGWRAADNKTS